MNSRNDLLALGPATLGECGARTMGPRIKPSWPGARIAAPAFPVRCAPGDNLAIHVAVASAAAGSALVVDASDQPERGYWGEVLTTAAEARGIRGLVIDGGVRDVLKLEAHRFPVFATTIALLGTVKVAGGAIGSPVSVGGAEVALGDWVVGDADGVVVIAGPDLENVISAGWRRSITEEAYFGRLRAGSTTLELLGLDPSNVEGATEYEPQAKPPT